MRFLFVRLDNLFAVMFGVIVNVQRKIHKTRYFKNQTIFGIIKTTVKSIWNPMSDSEFRGRLTFFGLAAWPCY